MKNDFLDALLAFRYFVSVAGCTSGRPAWFSDDAAWLALVDADEKARAAIAKDSCESTGLAGKETGGIVVGAWVDRQVDNALPLESYFSSTLKFPWASEEEELEALYAEQAGEYPYV